MFKNVPSEFKNFSPFHCCGLWEAVITTPPAALQSCAAICTVGVGTTPRYFTLKPDKAKFEITIEYVNSPNALPSLPTTIKFDFECFLQYSANAEVNLIIFAGIRFSPIIPRTPDTEAIIFSALPIFVLFY